MPPLPGIICALLKAKAERFFCKIFGREKIALPAKLYDKVDAEIIATEYNAMAYDENNNKLTKNKVREAFKERLKQNRELCEISENKSSDEQQKGAEKNQNKSSDEQQKGAEKNQNKSSDEQQKGAEKNQNKLSYVQLRGIRDLVKEHTDPILEQEEAESDDERGR